MRRPGLWASLAAAVVVAGVGVAGGLPGPASALAKAQPARKAKKSADKGPRKVWQTYRVGKGETLGELASLLGVSAADLKKWNRLRSDRLRPGTRLKFYAPRIEPQSVGRPSNGRLVGGVSVDPDGDNRGVGWVIAARREATWATPETVRYVRRCVSHYRHNYGRSKADPIAIGDLSRRQGGPLPPHKSHESGRDVDIGFILKKRAKNADDGPLRNATPATLDVAKQWFLLKCFLDNPETQMVFMEHSIVSALKEYVQKIYKKRKPLLRKYLRFFPGGGAAVIKADGEHTSHMHVRFRCPKGDRECIP